MGVDRDRQATARARKTAIISSLISGFDADNPLSYISMFRQRVKSAESRLLLANADVDGLVSAQMLSAYTGWEVAAVVGRTGTITVHPDFGSGQDLVDSGLLFGVDIFSPLFPGISNHPVLFGDKARRNSSLRQRLEDFDASISSAVNEHMILNPSAWVGIGASLGSQEPNGIPYKYPLGTAQFLLAVLEGAGLKPKLFDRQYLPWLIANCDGGVDTIRTYSWNAEMWWGALAAVAGPASHTEALFQLVSNQRPNEFLDVDRRLRYDEPQRSRFLNTKWNLVDESMTTISAVAEFITDLSGWPDPFRGGAESLSTWSKSGATRGVLPVEGLTKYEPSKLDVHLRAGLESLHMNFSVFKERGTALGWMLPAIDPVVTSLVDGAAPVEDIPEDEPSIPDADESQEQLELQV